MRKKRANSLSNIEQLLCDFGVEKPAARIFRKLCRGRGIRGGLPEKRFILQMTIFFIRKNERNTKYEVEHTYEFTGRTNKIKARLIEAALENFIELYSTEYTGCVIEVTDHTVKEILPYLNVQLIYDTHM